MSSFAAPVVDFEIDQGDDETFSITRQYSDGTAKPISGYTFWLTIKESIEESDADAAVQKTVTTHTDPGNGETEIDLPAAETATLAGLYKYDIQEKTAAGSINTLLQGTLYVGPDVTDSS